MIFKKQNTTTENDFKKLLKFWYNNEDKIITVKKSQYSQFPITVHQLDITNEIENFNLSFSFPKKEYAVCYLQYTDILYGDQEGDKNFHIHTPNWNYVQYYNDNFDGGEIEFENGLIHKPKKGDCLLFTGDEGHKVLNHKNFYHETIAVDGKEVLLNRRWVVVGHIKNEELFHKLYKSKKNLI